MKVQAKIKTSSEFNRLISDLSRDIVAQTAPEELPLFRAISAAYSKNPKKALQLQKSKDEDLGFGVAEAALLLTPIVLDVMKDVVMFLVGEITQSVREESSELISNRVKSMFKKYSPADIETNQAQALTPEQLLHVRQIALEKIRAMALSEDQAGLLADSIIGSLAIAT